MADAPIGIFDSGYGGLTVARAVLDQLPHERVLYLGDTARQPYGPRRIAQVRTFSLECMDVLLDRGVKALVIACNSASAAVLHDARERYDVPVVEVIRPAVRRAVAATRTDRVGVISTQATHRSHAYVDAFAAAPQIRVTSRACPRFVQFVESGITSGPELLSVAREYLAPFLRHTDTGNADLGHIEPGDTERGDTHSDHGRPVAAVDTLILGCTHYPLLTGVISYVMGDGVTLVSSAEETAKEVYRILADAGTLRADDLPPPVHEFHTTGDPHEFTRLARRFLGPEVGTVLATPSALPALPAPDEAPVRLTVVGCSGSVPGPASPAACYLVQAQHSGATFSLLLDLGSGALGPLQRHLALTEIDAIVLSHLHPDHCLDLCGLYVARRYGPLPRVARLPVHGPSGTARRMARAYDVPPTESDLVAQFAFGTLLDAAPLEIGPFTVTPYRVNHPVEAFGLRVEADGVVLAYSGDTDECDALAPLFRGASLLLADSAFVEGVDLDRGVHLSARRAAQAAVTAGGVQRLMLTHIPPWNDPQVSRAQAAEVWPGEVELAAGGATYLL